MLANPAGRHRCAYLCVDERRRRGPRGGAHAHAHVCGGDAPVTAPTHGPGVPAARTHAAGLRLACCCA